jgi:hypothetical protein
MLLPLIDAGSIAYLATIFYDKDDVAQAPTSVTVEVIDGETGTVIREATAETPVASSMIFEVTPDENAMLDATKDRERRRVIVRATFGAGDVFVDHFDYLIQNPLSTAIYP